MADPVSTTDLEGIYGDDEYYEGVVTDADGNTVDLTAGGSVDLVFTLRRRYTQSSTDLSKSLSSGISGDASGNYTVHILDTDSSSVTEGKVYHYALRYTDGSGIITTVARGKFTFLSSAATT